MIDLFGFSDYFEKYYYFNFIVSDDQNSGLVALKNTKISTKFCIKNPRIVHRKSKNFHLKYLL